MNVHHPLTPEQARDLAREASEAIRLLNHATLPADDWPGLNSPADAFDVLGALAELTCRLPQLLGQVSAFLQRQLQFDLLIVDDGTFAGDALGAVGTATNELESPAIDAARRLGCALMRAQQSIAFVAVRRDG